MKWHLNQTHNTQALFWLDSSFLNSWIFIESYNSSYVLVGDS